MPTLSQIHADSLAGILTDTGDVIIIGNPPVSYSVLAGPSAREINLMTGGFSQDYTLKFTLLLSTFTAQNPNIQTAEQLRRAIINVPFIYVNAAYMVKGLVIMQGGLQVQIDAKSHNQRA